MRNFVLAASLFACSCTSDTPGTINGEAFTIMDSATFVRTSRGLANVDLTDFVGTCASGASMYPKNSKDLRFLLADADADTPPTSPGTFTVHTLEEQVSGLYAECSVFAYDSACTGSDLMCTGGSVTLTAVDTSGTGHLAGSYDVMLGDDHLSGSFDAPTCANVNEDAPTCM